MIGDMNEECDRLSDGEGSRTKLIRYLEAMELSKKVRAGLPSHICRVDTRIPSYGFVDGPQVGCGGCDRFPSSIDTDAVYNIKDYDFFFYICVGGRKRAGFQGFLRIHEDDEFMLSTEHFKPKSRSDSDHSDSNHWPEMQRLLASEMNVHSEQWWDIYQETFTSDVSLIVVAVNKTNNRASFVGAGHDFSQATELDDEWAVSFNNYTVRCNVHSISEEHKAHTRLCFSWNLDEVSVEIHFRGDEFIKGGD